MNLFNKTLKMTFEQFTQEIEYGIYGDTDILQLIKILCQNRYNCPTFERKIIFLIEKLVCIYSL